MRTSFPDGFIHAFAVLGNLPVHGPHARPPHSPRPQKTLSAVMRPREVPHPAATKVITSRSGMSRSSSGSTPEERGDLWHL